MIGTLGHGLVMHAGANARCVHGIEESIAADAAASGVDHYRMEVVSVSGIGLRWDGESNRQLGKPVVVASPQLAAALPVFLNSRQLVQADRCLQIHHVVFEAALDDLVMLVPLVAETVPGVLAHPVQRRHSRPRDARFAAAEDHATLTGPHGLGDIEIFAAEIAKRASVLAVKLFADGVRAVLDHDEVMLACDGHDSVHRAGTTGEMHGQDGPRSRGDRRINRIRIDILARRIDVRQHWRQLRMNDPVHGGAERQRCGDHLTSRLDARGHLRRLHPAPGGEVLLELGYPRTVPSQPERRQASTSEITGSPKTKKGGRGILRTCFSFTRH